MKTLVEISPAQYKAINKLRELGGWRSAYEIKASLSTLFALLHKGLVKSRNGDKPGAFSMP